MGWSIATVPSAPALEGKTRSVAATEAPAPWLQSSCMPWRLTGARWTKHDDFINSLLTGYSGHLSGL